MENQPTHRISRTAAILMAAAAAMPLVTEISAQSAVGIAGREKARRQQAVQDSEAALFAGREAYAKGDYETAVSEYRRALDLLPDAPATQVRRDEYTAHLSDGSVALAQKFRSVGKYDEARGLLENVLSPDVSPHNQSAKQELEYLDNPILTNPSLSYGHTKNVDEVRRALYKGEGFFNLGDYDSAEREFRNVLRIDQYNKAARRWLERCAGIKSDYYRSAYDETRARLLMEVDKAWELAVPPSEIENYQSSDQQIDQGVGSASISSKLRNIIIPQVDFEDTTISEAVEFLRQRAFELDQSSIDPARKGLNIIVSEPRSGLGGGLDAADLTSANPGEKVIKELRLRQVPLEFVIQSICDLTDLKYKIDEYSVRIVPIGEGGDTIISRTFSIPPDFRAQLRSSGGGGGADAAADDPFGESSGGSALGSSASVQQLLESRGIGFPDGSSASIAGNSLIVRNTPANVDLIEQVVEGTRGNVPKQIKILTKFVEISQENGEELSFDWAFSGPGTGSFRLGGGNQGNGVAPRTGSADLNPLNAGIPGLNPITAGNRSGNGAISGDSISSLLGDAVEGVGNGAPGVLSIGGVFSEYQFSVLLRGLSQKRGTDVMTAPSVMARSGEKATIEIIREFIYPTEFEPPEVPERAGSSPVVTPVTPTAFETRNTGVTLEIEPILGGNDYVIDLSFAPEIVEFEGFINYGSPIQSAVATDTVVDGLLDAINGTTTVVLTDNRIEQPVFSTRRVQTAVTLYDGHTIAVGGLMSENVQNVEDKVPILGDIPYIGRLFQSKASNTIKTNLIIFVTARIIDASGRPLRGTDLFGSANTANTSDSLGVLPPIQ